jgi:hypothetical protein
MKITLTICAAIALMASIARAEEPPARERKNGWDYGLGFAARAKPLGAIFTGAVGHGFVLWDKGGKWQYGYVRPAAEVESIGVNSRVGVRIDLFPVSIFGITLRNEYGMRLVETDLVDCKEFLCDGGVWRNSIEAKLGLEAAGVFLLTSLRWMAISPVDEGRPFYDDRVVLRGLPGGDASVNALAIAGYRINDQWSAGILDEWKNMRGPGQYANLAVAFARLEQRNWSYVGGAGYYSSEVSPPGLTGVLTVTWTGLRGVGLF